MLTLVEAINQLDIVLTGKNETEKPTTLEQWLMEDVGLAYLSDGGYSRLSISDLLLTEGTVNVRLVGPPARSTEARWELPATMVMRNQLHEVIKAEAVKLGWIENS